ncbi:MAG: hypothetical protein K8U03_11595 [Planctomycetia bacterium]|nr:hypothetical protein [Planctomycetia bacterium]
MKSAAYLLSFGCLTSALCFVAEAASAQNPDYPGYLGVYVVEGNGGMRISNFIRNTPAAELAQQGNIARNDTITKLGGRPTRTLQELRVARNRIPEGKEAKMVLKSGNEYYHVWIGRSEATAAAVYGSAAPGSAAPGSPAPGADRFSKGARGEGDEGDFRDPKGTVDPPKSGGGEGEFRDKN